MSLAAAAVGADSAPAPKGTLAGAFQKPSKPSVLVEAEGWPMFFDRAPVNLAPKGGKTKVVVLGTGTPAPNAVRFGPALAVIVNGSPYFVDAGEGW